MLPGSHPSVGPQARAFIHWLALLTLQADQPFQLSASDKISAAGAQALAGTGPLTTPHVKGE